MDELKLKAYAKINLALDVTGRLENGYHQVRMIMQTVGIYDVLSFKIQHEGITVITDSDILPADENNLVYQAAKLMKEQYGIRQGICIRLEKNIPIAAGMAGGSTDAAAVLRGMNRLFKLGASDGELMKLGVRIGADVPYCIIGGTALAEGIGEELTALRAVPECTLLVAKPDISVSTKYVYEQLDSKQQTTHPDIDGMVEAIGQGSLHGIVTRMENVLEEVTARAYPVIDELKKRMRELGAENSMMSGSGPTVFGIFTHREKAEEAYRVMKAEDCTVQLFVTQLQGGAGEEL